MTKLLNKVIESVQTNRSGAITVHQICKPYRIEGTNRYAPGGERIVTWDRLTEWCTNNLPANSFESWSWSKTMFRINLDKGTVTPMTPEAWEILEELNNTMTNFKFKVNGQELPFSIDYFFGWLPEGISHDWETANRKRAANDHQNRLCGYGSDRHGGRTN